MSVSPLPAVRMTTNLGLTRFPQATKIPTGKGAQKEHLNCQQEFVQPDRSVIQMFELLISETMVLISFSSILVPRQGGPKNTRTQNKEHYLLYQLGDFGPGGEEHTGKCIRGSDKHFTWIYSFVSQENPRFYLCIFPLDKNCHKTHRRTGCAVCFLCNSH